MTTVNFKLETLADPAWTLEFQRESLVSSGIKTNEEIYSNDPDLNALIEKAKGKCSIDLGALNLGIIRDWYLLLAQDEEWFHKDTFQLSFWDNKCSAFLNLDYIFDNYELDYEVTLEDLSKVLKSSGINNKLEIEGELTVHLENSELSELVEVINKIVTRYPPKKSNLTLDANWELFLKKLKSITVTMPPLENAYSFNKLSFMSLLSHLVNELQKKQGKERILIEFSTVLTSLKSNPSVGDDLNSQLAYLNRFLCLELTDWSKFV